LLKRVAREGPPKRKITKAQAAMKSFFEAKDAGPIETIAWEKGE